METTASDINSKMVVANEKMQEIVRRAGIYAPYNRPVLLTGETGTGKEVLARFIHEASKRKGPLVAINVASISESLIESELFGHERGSFTGAVANKKGLLELADNGTVFFDEIAEMTLPFQAKLLRVVDGNASYRFRRVGGTSEIVSDFRIICASNRPLEELVAEGKFLKDLFYRMQVFRLHLPPLRERQEDIIALTRHYLEKICTEFGKKPLQISLDVWAGLISRPWPGNIRELMTVIARAVALCKEDVSELKPEHFDLDTMADTKPGPKEKTGLPELERLLVPQGIKSASDACVSDKKSQQGKTIEQIRAQKEAFIAALEKNNWNITKTAEALGIACSTLRKDIKTLKIVSPKGCWKRGRPKKTAASSHA